MMAEYRNIHGRKGGRGLRPWLLIPKVVAVALIIGGLAAVLVLDQATRSLAMTTDQVRLVGRLIGLLFKYQIVPATILALVLGLLLLLQHPRQFLRMRWLIVKLLLVAVTVPAAHILLRSQVQRMQESPPAQVGPCVAGILGGFLAILLLGRLKPRLGQKIRPSEKRPD